MHWLMEGSGVVYPSASTGVVNSGSAQLKFWRCRQHYGVVNSRFGTAKMGGDVVEVDWGIHPESESGTCHS